MALVAAPGVVVLDVAAQDVTQMPVAGDEDPVGALAANRCDPPFCEGVYPGRLRRGGHNVDAGEGEHGVEGGGELRVAVPDQVGESAPGLLQVRGQVSGLLDGPVPCGMGGDAEQVDPPGPDLDDESRVQPVERDGVDVEEGDRQ